MILMLRYRYIVSAILLMFSLTSACDHSETSDDLYAGYEHLRKATEPGNWIPSFIPRSATEIKGRHKIDTGAQVLTFYFEGNTSTFLEDHCKQTTTSEVEFPESGFLDVSWWPKELVRTSVPSQELKGYKFFQCERQAFLAVTERNNRHQAFYWRISLT